MRGIRSISGPRNTLNVWFVPRRPHPERSARCEFFARLCSGGANNNDNNNNNHNNNNKMIITITIPIRVAMTITITITITKTMITVKVITKPRSAEQRGASAHLG